MAILSHCCCFSVETGSTMIATMSFFSSALTFVGSLPFQMKHNQKHFKERIILMQKADGLRDIDPYTLHNIVTGIITMNLVTSILLLAGIRWRQRLLMVPWILWNGLTQMTVMLYMMSKHAPLGGDFLLVYALFFGGLLVVISHYQNLTQEEREFTRAAMAIEALENGGERRRWADSHTEFNSTQFYRDPLTLWANTRRPARFSFFDSLVSASEMGRTVAIPSANPGEASDPQRSQTEDDLPPPYPGLSHREKVKSEVRNDMDNVRPPPSYEDALRAAIDASLAEQLQLQQQSQDQPPPAEPNGASTSAAVTTPTNTTQQDQPKPSDK